MFADAAILLDTLTCEHCNFEVRHFFRQLQLRRCHAPNRHCRKELRLEIRSFHRNEVGSWKFQSFAERLVEVSTWKCLKSWLPNPFGRAIAQHPLEDEFAVMLENLFIGPWVPLPKPVVLMEDV